MADEPLLVAATAVVAVPDSQHETVTADGVAVAVAATPIASPALTPALKLTVAAVGWVERESAVFFQFDVTVGPPAGPAPAPVHQLCYRYSELRKIHSALGDLAPEEFPPRQLMATMFGDADTVTRQTELADYLTALLDSPAGADPTLHAAFAMPSAAAAQLTAAAAARDNLAREMTEAEAELARDAQDLCIANGLPTLVRPGVTALSMDVYHGGSGDVLGPGGHKWFELVRTTGRAGYSGAVLKSAGPAGQVVLRFAVERRSSKLQPDAATTRKLLVVTATTGREVAEAMPSKSDEPEKGEQPLGEPPQELAIVEGSTGTMSQQIGRHIAWTPSTGPAYFNGSWPTESELRLAGSDSGSALVTATREAKFFSFAGSPVEVTVSAGVELLQAAGAVVALHLLESELEALRQRAVAAVHCRSGG